MSNFIVVAEDGVYSFTPEEVRAMIHRRGEELKDKFKQSQNSKREE